MPDPFSPAATKITSSAARAINTPDPTGPPTMTADDVSGASGAFTPTLVCRFSFRATRVRGLQSEARDRQEVGELWDQALIPCFGVF